MTDLYARMVLFLIRPALRLHARIDAQAAASWGSDIKTRADGPMVAAGMRLPNRIVSSDASEHRSILNAAIRAAEEEALALKGNKSDDIAQRAELTATAVVTASLAALARLNRGSVAP